MSKPFFTAHGARPKAGIFLSGSGSNAETLLKTLAQLPHSPLEIPVLITDAPLTSRARELGKFFSIPVIELDIKQFYLERGETRVSIATPSGQRIREEWTDQLRGLIAPLGLDFGIFAGFVPLTNITADFPCLNVHPGDLSYLKNGRRLLVGLHTIPIELAILEGLDYMRSSVIVVEPYSGAGGEMDSGHLLGISAKVPLDLMGHTREELASCLPLRPAKRPKGGYADALETVAKANQNMLKENGDWIVLPKTVLNFAQGKYGMDDDGKLLFEGKPVLTVEYGSTQREVVR